MRMPRQSSTSTALDTEIWLSMHREFGYRDAGQFVRVLCPEEVRVALNASPEQAARWLLTQCRDLPVVARPIDLIDSDLAAVVAAARKARSLQAR